MTEQPYNTTRSTEASQFGMQALWRLAVWGGLATLALLAAVMSAYSNAGAQRQTAAITSGEGAKQPGPPLADIAPQPSEPAEETRRLAEAVRNLAAEHEQVLTRIAAIERNVDGVTGSIKRERMTGPAQQPITTPATIPVARPESPSVPIGVIDPPQTLAPQPGAGEAGGATAPEAGNRSVTSNPVRAMAPAEPLPAASGLGVDVGGAANYEGLRTIWHATKNSDPELLEDLYPVVTVRENGKTHGVDLRVVIGPLADAEAASRLCMTLAEAHQYCQPVAFEGQRLTMIDTAPTKGAASKIAPPAPHHPGSGHVSSSHAPESIAPFSSASYPRGK